jgi:diguanylate cyclase (GGDEF)-like protein
LFICFAAVVLCFATSTFIAEYGGFKIQGAAQAIATNSAPSQRYLGLMRTDLRHLLALAYRCAAAAHKGPCPIGAPDVLADLDTQWASYQGLPTFPGEREGWGAVETEMRALREVLPDRLPEGETSKALAQFESLIEALDVDLGRLVQLNLTNEDLLSAEIQTDGSRIGLLALIMDGFGLLFAVAMGAVALRVVQRYTRRREETLSVLSLRDELTGLYNRRGLFRKAAEQIDGARRMQQRLLLVFADLDDLKQINDRLGHSAGDRALVETAALMRQTFRASDVLARLGGDEFVALSPAANDDLADSVRQRLSENLGRRNARTTNDFELGISFGMAWYEPESSETLERLLKRADSAMYREKRQRREPDGSPARPAETVEEAPSKGAEERGRR